MKNMFYTGALALILTPAMLTAESVKYVGQPVGSEMRIDGKATGKTWNCVGKIITGSFEAEDSFLKDGKGKPACAVSIPVRTLKSSGGPVMDKRMMNEMNTEKFPKIEFKVTEMTLKGDAGATMKFDAKGDLSIAGTTKNVSFPITMEVGAEGVKFSGTLDTKMSDFKITPPEFAVAGVGMKTEDAITLTWTWNTAKAAK